MKKDQNLYGTEKRELDKNSYQYKYIPVELKSAEHANVLNCKVFPCSMVTSNDSAIFGPTKKCLVDNLSTGPYSSLNLKKSSATLGYSAELKTSALLILGPNLFDNFLFESSKLNGASDSPGRPIYIINTSYQKYNFPF